MSDFDGDCRVSLSVSLVTHVCVTDRSVTSDTQQDNVNISVLYRCLFPICDIVTSCLDTSLYPMSHVVCNVWAACNAMVSLWLSVIWTDHSGRFICCHPIDDTHGNHWPMCIDVPSPYTAPYTTDTSQ